MLQNSEQAATTPEDEFASAFAERAAASSAGRAGTVDAKDSESTDQGAATVAPQVGEQGESQGSQQPAATNAASAKPEGQPQATDNASQDQRQQPRSTGKSVQELETLLADALHRERSVAARNSANDRAANQVRDENKRLAAKVAELEAKLAAGPAANVSGKDADDVLSSTPELQTAVQRRISEATSGIEARLNAALSKLDSLQAGESQSSAQQQTDNRAEAAARVQAAMDREFTAAWRADVNGADFGLWLGSQSKSIQDQFATSVDPSECAAVLHSYYGSRGGVPQARTGDPLPVRSGEPKPIVNGGKPATSTSKQRLIDAAGIAPRGSVVPAGKPDPNDFEGGFAEAAAAKAAARGNHLQGQRL